MHRHRRLVVTDRVIPFLAAFVGLVALAGAVLVQLTADARTARITEEITALRAAVDALAQRTDTLATNSSAPVDNDGTIEAMLALQDRMNRLEEEWESRATSVAATSAPGTAAFSASADGAPAEIDPSWPTENCIPIGTRFMASSGEEIAICQSPVVVKVAAITADSVMVEGAGVINETAFKPIAGTNCQLNVFSADAEGFAELRVSCN